MRPGTKRARIRRRRRGFLTYPVKNGACCTLYTHRSVHELYVYEVLLRGLHGRRSSLLLETPAQARGVWSHGPEHKVHPAHQKTHYTKSRHRFTS